MTARKGNSWLLVLLLFAGVAAIVIVERVL